METVSDEFGDDVQVQVCNRAVEIITYEEGFGSSVWKTFDVATLDKLIAVLQRAREHLV